MRQRKTERVRGSVVTKALQKLAHNSVLQLIGSICAPFIAVIAGLLLTNVWEMSKGFAKMQADMQALSAIVTATNVDRYTGTQAANDKAYLQGQIDEIKKRQDRNETVRAAIKAASQQRAK